MKKQLCLIALVAFAWNCLGDSDGDWVMGPWHIETTEGKRITAIALRHAYSKTYAKDATLLMCNIAGQEAKVAIADIKSLRATEMLNDKWAKEWQITMAGGESATFTWKNVVGANTIQGKTAFGDVTVDGKEIKSLSRGDSSTAGTTYRLILTSKDGKTRTIGDIELGKEFRVGSSTLVFSKQ
jgi:hypothetical protein